MLTAHGVKIAPETPPCARAVRDERVLEEIRRVHGASTGLYGVRKIYHQLRRAGGVDGVPVARCTVERLMREDGLQGVRRGRAPRTTCPDMTTPRAPDLVGRQFTASRPNQLWVVDFTYVATFAGFVYVPVAIDVFSRMIVGWRGRPVDAHRPAARRAGHDVAGLVHHSDAGSQYTSFRYTDRLLDAGAQASIGTVGDSYDNALAESVNGLYKTELVHWQGPWRGADDLELATLTWVDWFNNTRLHSSLDYQTPAEVEATHYRYNQPIEQPLAGQPAL